MWTIWRLGRALAVLGYRALRRRNPMAWDAIATMAREADWPLSATQSILEAPVTVSLRPCLGPPNLTLLESVALAALVRARRPAFVVEIGTGDGLSAWLMAENSSGEILTVDVRPDSGRLIVDHPRIQRLVADAGTLDWSPWHGTADVVFVDGDHAEGAVARDARIARELVRPNGLIVFHDFDGHHRGVVRALSPWAVTRIAGTRLAVQASGDPLRT